MTAALLRTSPMRNSVNSRTPGDRFPSELKLARPITRYTYIAAESTEDIPTRTSASRGNSPTDETVGRGGGSCRQQSRTVPHRRPADLPAADRGQILPVSEPALPDRPPAAPGPAGSPGRPEHRPCSTNCCAVPAAGRRGPRPRTRRGRQGRWRLVPPAVADVFAAHIDQLRAHVLHKEPAGELGPTGAVARHSGPRLLVRDTFLTTHLGGPRRARRRRTPGRGPAARRVGRTGRHRCTAW